MGVWFYPLPCEGVDYAGVRPDDDEYDADPDDELEDLMMAMIPE